LKNNMDIKLYENAWRLALQAHEGQKYGKHDYVYHLKMVMGLCATYGEYEKKDETVIVAILHDMVEDHPNFIGYLALGSMFGEEIVVAIEAITKRENEGYHEYIVRCSKNKIARMVKTCDLLCNLSGLDEPDNNIDPYRKMKLRKRYRTALIYLGNNQ